MDLELFLMILLMLIIHLLLSWTAAFSAVIQAVNRPFDELISILVFFHIRSGVYFINPKRGDSPLVGTGRDGVKRISSARSYNV